LVSPMIRQEERLVEVSWQEALELIADRLAKYKGREFGLISSAKCSNEDNYVMQKLARVVMGSNNIDVYSRLCHAPSLVALRQSLGRGAMSNPISEIDDAACIFVIGANPTASHPIIGQRLRRAARKGAKLIVANPRQIELCRHASLWLQHRPGSDVALLMGMMRVIVDEGLADWSFIEQQCEDFAPFADSLRDFDPKSVARVTAVPQELLIEAARTYANHKPSTILYASGITQHTHGSDNVAAIANLAMLTGSGISPLQGQNNAQGACDMGALPDFYPGYQLVVDPEANSKFEAAWGYRLNWTPGLSLGEMLHAAHQGSLKALYLVGANPMLTMADAQYVQHAMERVEFLIVQDLFLSETARLAHAVLPAASFAEKDGTFTNTESRVQRVRQAIEPIGSARPDWWIASQIAKKLGAQGFDFEHPGQIMEEIAHLTPSYGGISYSHLEKESVYTGGFTQGKGRFMPLSYKAAAELPDDDYPLMLVTERSLYQFGAMSRKVQGLNTLKAEEQVEINPADAASLGFADSEMVRVISRRGEVQAKAKITEASPPGVVAMGFHFAESPTNRLTNSAMDPVSEIPGSKICAVRLENSH
jgi:formate dehydrogenase alpha subunit